MRVETVRAYSGDSKVIATVEKGFGSFVAPALEEANRIVQARIDEDPDFAISTVPIEPSISDPSIIRKMCEASVRTMTAPIDSVGGAVADFIARELRDRGCGQAVVDSNGVVALYTTRTIILPVGAGGNMSGLAFRVPPQNSIIGACTVSEDVGTWFHTGLADAAMSFCENAALAQSSAEVLGGKVFSPNDLVPACEDVASIEGVRGCMVMMDDDLAVCGEVPEVVLLGDGPEIEYRFKAIRYSIRALLHQPVKAERHIGNTGSLDTSGSRNGSNHLRCEPVPVFRVQRSSDSIVRDGPASESFGTGHQCHLSPVCDLSWAGGDRCILVCTGVGDAIPIP